MTNDELRTETMDRFDNVAEAYTNVGAEMAEALSRVHQAIKAEGETTRRHFDLMVEEMRDSVKVVAETTRAEAETTRRHFDLMVQEMRDSVKIVAEATAHHTGVWTITRNG